MVSCSLVPVFHSTVEKLMVVHDTGISTNYNTAIINPII